jgi:2-polyprenyl-3-methyl-5-hydroxy-6-metoxy-1,4-benzoquinol methylase
MRRRKISAQEIKEARAVLEAKYALRDVEVDAGPKMLKITAPVRGYAEVKQAAQSASDQRGRLTELLKGRDDLAPSPESTTGHIPHWSELWPCSRAMAAYFGHCVRMRSVDTLEVNCGLGTAGLGAAAKGARVTLTDASEDAVLFARFNALQNGFSHVKPSVFDWKNDRLPNFQGSLIFADVLHTDKNFEHVFRMLQDNLAPGRTAFLAEPGRNTATQFLDLLRGANYRVRLDMERVQEPESETYYLVSVLRIKKDDGSGEDDDF